jgi:SecD/SecF fusion protein
MQGKGLIKFFAWLFAIVFLGQFLLTYPTGKVETAATEFGAQVAAKSASPNKEAVEKAARLQFLDSMGTVKVFSLPLIKDYTYNDLKKQQLALGLDLKGGMSVVLQVNLQDFLKSMANSSTDPNFTTALKNADERLKQGGNDFISLFVEEYKKVSGGQKLAPLFMRNEGLKGQLTLDSGDDFVTKLIRTKANETVNLTYKRLKERIDQFGVTQPNVSLDAARDLIVVELPGVDNPKRARLLLEQAAKLEFWDVYRANNPAIEAGFRAADQKALAIASGVIDTSKVTKIDSSKLGQGPILSNMTLNRNLGQGFSFSPAVVATAEKNKMNIINTYLEKPEIKALFPRDMIFRWSAKPMKNKALKDAVTEGTTYELYALKSKRGTEGQASLEGDRVVGASADPDPQSGQIAISLRMDGDGARTWAEMTKAAANDNNREIAILLDDQVVSAPSVRGEIAGGNSSITGDYTVDEAKDMATILQIGKLPARTQIVQESVVGPSLGQENINKSMTALGLGLLAIIVLMIAYYSTGGILAIVGLIVNIFFIVGALTSYGTVLTLPGIAGIVLTMAAAVDANVIIYERIREELMEGKSLATAITDGFKFSAPAIFDANISNLLIAFVMSYFGLGPIKGFAVVLIIGIVATVFTAFFLVHLITEWYLGRGKNIAYSAPWSATMFRNIKIDWVGQRKKWYILSSIIILIGAVSFFKRGFELGVDFKGGWSYNVQFESPVNGDQLREVLDKKFGGTTIVKSVSTDNTYNIITSFNVNENGEESAELVRTKLYEGVKEVSGTAASIEAFKKQDGTGTHITSYSKVGSYVADDIKNSAFKAIFFSLLLIFVYIFVRFNKWQFSLGAIIALFHDVLLVMSVFTIFHGFLPWSMEVDQAFVAAILTIIGYSMNDTVVVYDRIREFSRSYHGRSNAEIINDAINNTLSRTIMTSFITFLSMLILFAFGGSSVRGFAFALVVGIVVGTYSSIFIATPIMMDFTKESLTSGAKEVDMTTENTPAKV